uniref:tRNA (cytidine(34)-2'-O)-methyltransferase n=1 Tax=Magnetococcus massalia (strain MO-1) TaxID=451514 RepID=A0A1S7LL82_MAGMO|nr:Uncharacterized tRNA/rRNA methyltransferase yibK [Candidatus Magnetococcus massalia]
MPENNQTDASPLPPPAHSPLQVVLFRPEIPPNTGNIQRLCAVTGTTLQLVGPLGFKLDDRSLARAGMDYREWATVHSHRDWQSCEDFNTDACRWIPITTQASRHYHQMHYQPGDRLLFGAEGSGLPAQIHEKYGQNSVRIPMLARGRSLNLANSVSIVLYEALRQLEFPQLI